MKKWISLVFVIGIVSFSFMKKKKKSDNGDIVYASNELIAPEVVAQKIINNEQGMYIFNTGPVDDIKGAINIGPVEQAKYLDKFKQIVDTLDPTSKVYIYCGCCPLAVCPNLKPAYALLQAKGFAEYKVIQMVQGIEEDWISKGYPTVGY